MRAGAAAFGAALLAGLAAAPEAQAFEAEQVLPSVVSVLPVWDGRPPDAEAPEGSGVAVLGEGHVATALHVVRGARAIFVRKHDGEIVEARLAGSDPASDIALLRLDAELPPLPLAGDARPGTSVCAVGNAFGLDLSVTCGVVSRVHQAGIGFNQVEDFVQTDASVNPGASGGALVDEDGRLVGLLSAIFTKQSDANIGVNFAVSSPLLERVLRALAGGGPPDWLDPGLRMAQHPPHGEAGRAGARILAVGRNSPAEAADLRPGDVIVEAAGRRVAKPADLASVLARHEAPAEIALTVLDGETERDVVLAFE